MPIVTISLSKSRPPKDQKLIGEVSGGKSMGQKTTPRLFFMPLDSWRTEPELNFFGDFF